jgi:hypothetical protein
MNKLTHKYRIYAKGGKVTETLAQRHEIDIVRNEIVFYGTGAIRLFLSSISAIERQRQSGSWEFINFHG